MRTIVLFLLLFFSAISTANAAVTFRLDFSGIPNENKYFFCMPNTGCFSILDGKRGKTYPIEHKLGIHSIYIMDVSQNMRVFAQPMPSSCNLSNITDKTITITGNLVQGEGGGVLVENMQCSVQ